MNNTSVKDKVIRTLNDNGFQEWSKRINNLYQQLEKGTNINKIAAAKEIQGLCNMRALGDLRITTMSGWKWSSLLQEFNKLAQKKIKNLN